LSLSSSKPYGLALDFFYQLMVFLDGVLWTLVLVPAKEIVLGEWTITSGEEASGPIVAFSKGRFKEAKTGFELRKCASFLQAACEYFSNTMS